MRHKTNYVKSGNVLFKVNIIIVFVLLLVSANAQQYRKMMEDVNVNVYDVVEEAEKYFKTRDKNVKGSGWKGYQRWLFENEPKYYPRGDRTKVDPYFASNSIKAFRLNNLNFQSSYTAGWEDLGPHYIERVTGHSAVGLGRVETSYVDPNDSLRIYLGSRSGGFWKTLDGGITWAGNSTDFLFATGVNTMTVSPMNSSDVLINLRNSKNGTTHGLYRSIDGGENWTQTNFNPVTLGWGGLGSNHQVYKIAYHPTVPDLVFIGSNSGLFRSSDVLTTWTQPIASLNFQEIVFHPTDPNIIYTATTDNTSAVYVSIDGGVNFTTSSAIPGNSSRIHLSTSPSCPDCVFIGSSDGIWKSIDKGMNYTLVSTPGISNYGGFAVSDVNTNYMLFGDIDVHRSTDGGITFNQATYWSQGNADYNSIGTYVHADIRSAESRNGVFWAMTDGFLCKSLDQGVTWQIFEGQGIRENYNLGVSQSNHYRTICGSQDNGTSIKTENGWIEFFGADGMEGIIHPLNDDWMIGSYQNGGRIRTFDGGLTNSVVTPSGQDGYWIAPLFYDPNNHMTVYSFGENVFKSENFGTTWTNIGTPGFKGSISYATIAENNSDIIVVTRSEFIEKSVDGGATFTSIKGTLPGYSITDVAFDPNDDNVIVVTYGRHQNDNSKVFISTDQGVTWQNITYNLNNMPVRSVVVDHTDASNIYVGTEIGIYKKAMADNIWSLYNPDLPNTTILELDIMRGSNTLRAATWGRGLWEYTLDGRMDNPSILTTKITNQPTDATPKEGIDQFVTSTITYDKTISSAYVEWSVNTPTFDNFINMTNTYGDTWVSDLPLPDYPVGTKMYFKVFAVGNHADTTETYKFMYIVKPFEYCTARGSTDTASDYIDFVSLNGMENSSGQDYYGNFLDSLIVLDLDSTYTLRVDLRHHWSPDTTGAWIDFNKDAIFSDDEFITLSELDAQHESYGSFTVPSNAMVEDTTIMRVRSTYWNDAPEPCGNATGEVEDYAIIIKEFPEITWYADSDGDSYGDSNETKLSRSQPAGYVLNSADCDDGDANINPETIWYADTDGDGYGDANVSQISCIQPDGYVLDNTDCEDSLFSLCDFLLSPIIYLQGAYDSNVGLMCDELRMSPDMPLVEPYTDLGYIHVGGGGDQEGVEQSVFDITGPNAIVDWVFLELRDKTDATTVMATRSALLQRDGDVVDVDGISPVLFADMISNEFYLVIKHRNHLGVMRAMPVVFSDTPVEVDFTTDPNNITGGANGIATLEDGKLGLYSGDFNKNGQVQNTDYAEMALTIGASGYVVGDFDLNGQVQNTDLQLKLLPNIGKGQGFP